MLRPVGQIPGSTENTNQASVSPGSVEIREEKEWALCPVAFNKLSAVISLP